jgi:hypothetical protein
MHDSGDRQLNLAPGLRHPATGPKDIWCGQIADSARQWVRLVLRALHMQIVLFWRW